MLHLWTHLPFQSTSVQEQAPNSITKFGSWKGTFSASILPFVYGGYCWKGNFQRKRNLLRTHHLLEFRHINSTTTLKGHGNETDFLGFLQKLVPHRSLTLSFEPFRFWLRIRRNIPYREMTRGVADSLTRRVRESMTPRLGEWESRLLNV